MPKTEIKSEYDQQAEDFLKETTATFEAVRIGRICSPWCEDDKHIHGDKHEIKLTRNGRTETFEFWNSYADTVGRQKAHDKKFDRKFHKPNLAPLPVKPYDFLACISSTAYCPISFRSFCDDFGYETDSRKAD